MSEIRIEVGSVGDKEFEIWSEIKIEVGSVGGSLISRSAFLEQMSVADRFLNHHFPLC